MTVTRTGYVDTDTHVYEPLSVWSDYIDPSYRAQSPAWVEQDGRLLVDIGGVLFPQTSHPGYGHSYGSGADKNPVANDPANRIGHMDAAGVAVQVIFPTLGMAGFDSSVADPGLAGALSRAYNRYMGGFCSSHPDRLKGAMLVPANHPDVAAAELREAREQHGLSVLFLNPTPPQDVPWSSPRYDQLWSVADELDVTVVFHESTSGAPPNTIGIARYANAWPLTYLVTHVLEAQLAFADMILGGALERFPGLRVGAAEAHVGWIPSLLSILDRNVGEGKRIFAGGWGETALTLKPTEYFARQCFAMAFPDDDMIGEVIDLVGPSAITIATDWPHPLAESRDGLAYVDERTDLTASHRDALHENSWRLFGSPS